MKTFFKTLVCLLILVPAGFAQPELKTAILTNFQFEKGGTLDTCVVAFRIFGRPNIDSSNVVLYPTWFAGNSGHMASLIGPGKLIDSSKYCVIVVDALGDGYSSSPSNTKLSEGRVFPEITIRDMVNSQYRMLTEKMKLKSLHAVLGGSMGSMQAFEWLVAYPKFMSKVIAYVCTPKLTAYDLLWMNWADNLINTGKACKRTDKEIWRDLNTLMALLSRTPEHIVSSVKTDTFYNYYNSMLRDPSATFTLANYQSQLHAMIGHDIFRYAGGSMDKTAETVAAELLMIYSDEDHLIRSESSSAFSKVLKNKTVVMNNGMGHMCVGKELKRVGEVITEFLLAH